MRAALLVVVGLLAAGCVSAPGDVDRLGATLPRPVLPHLDLTDEHDHTDRASHAVSWNVELLGYDPVAPDTTKLGRINHVAVQGTRAFVSAYQLAKDAPPGLAIFDIAAADPVLLSTVVTDGLVPIDVHVSSDGKYAVLAGHGDPRLALPGPANTCTGTPMVNVCTPIVPAGVVLLDVVDAAAPEVVAEWRSAPSGAHTAKVVAYAGGHYVFIASYGFSYVNRLASHVEILRVDDTPLGTRLVPVAEFFASRPSGNDGEVRTFVHDVFIAEHPTAGWIMYVSYWDGGVVLVDVNDPASPREIAAWRDFDAALYGNIHFARPVGVIGERHVSFAAPEFGSADHAGEAYVLDTTDPAAPVLLAKWVLPGDPVNDGGYRFSPHNFDPYGTLLVYAHYHGGVWFLDLADPRAPVVKGYVFPTVPEGEPAFESTENAPHVWAAVWDEAGTVWASDVGTGLYHYRLVDAEPGAPPYEAALSG